MKEDAKQRRSHVDKVGKLSAVRQCELLKIHRSGVFYGPAGETALNLELMRLMDEKNLLHPWLGVPHIVTWLQKDMGCKVNKNRIERLFRRYVVGWSLSNTMTSHWCKRTLATAIVEHGVPEILNTDQGSQLTAREFADWAAHTDQGIRLS